MVLKNILAFCAAASIFLAVAAGALFIIKNDKINAGGLFGFDQEKGMIFLGKSISIDKSVFDGISDHLKVCSNISSMIFPDFLSTPAKDTAMLAGTAVSGIVSDIYIALSDFVYGNM